MIAVRTVLAAIYKPAPASREFLSDMSSCREANRKYRVTD
jgi:hypothetical protein